MASLVYRGATEFGVKKKEEENGRMDRKQETREIAGISERIAEWQEGNAKATLTEMEIAIDGELHKLRSQIIKRLVKERESKEATNQACPNCGRKMGKNGKKKRQLKTKGGETVDFERQQMRCFHCGMTLFPPR
jgi:hypothetical protein